MTGNKCGHIASSPKIFSSKKNTVFVFKKAINNIVNFYSEPGKYLKKLQFIMPNGRQRRSESREAIASIVSVLLHHTDLSTKSVVKMSPDGVAHSVTISSIANLTGMSYRRCIRAIRQLKKSDYLYVDKIDSDYTVPRLKRIDYSMLTDLSVKFSEIEQTKNYYYKRNGLQELKFSDIEKFEKQRLSFINKKKAKSKIKSIFGYNPNTPKIEAVTKDNYVSTLVYANPSTEPMQIGQSIGTLLGNKLGISIPKTTATASTQSVEPTKTPIQEPIQTKDRHPAHCWGDLKKQTPEEKQKEREELVKKFNDAIDRAKLAQAKRKKDWEEGNGSYEAKLIYG